MNSSTSIVVPTFNRKLSLLRLFRSLVEVIEPDTEIIVVEQEKNNGIAIKGQAKKLDLNLKYYFLKKRNTPSAMNVGVQKAKGECVLFLDDDVTVKEGLIREHLKNFSDPSVAVTVGRVITDGQPVEPKRTDTGRINWLGEFTDGFSSIIKQEVDTVIGCNTCWRRDVYEKMGGMDELFTGNALRLESDLSLRAKKLGYKILFEPKALVYHHREETGGARKTEGRLQWYFDFFSNETYFFLKYFNKLLLPVFFLTKWEWALRCMFGFGREVNLRSMVTPAMGIIDGIRKYRRYRKGL